MPRYDVPVWQMCVEAARELPEVFAPRDVIRKVHEMHPEVMDVTIRCHVIALSPNHPSSKYYSLSHKFFRYLGGGRFTLLKSEQEREPLTLAKSEGELEEEEEVDLGFSFEFEADLQRHLVSNLAYIEEGLKLFTDEGQRTGVQYDTEMGRIDILAVDKKGGFVIIEIKSGRATDKVFAQLSRYMGWVQKHLAKGRGVRGIIIAKEVTDELKYATLVSGSVTVKEYEVNFSFHDAKLD